MAKQHQEISNEIKQFIEKQKIFFVATAASDGRVNVSPKGMDSLQVLGGNRVIWLNVTGSGNETAAHVQELPRMTIMFCSFEEQPMILRLYGQAKAIHRNDPEWSDLYSRFEPVVGARQVFDLHIDLVQTSCGFAVPFFDYAGEREQLNSWAQKRGEEAMPDYWAKNNQTSLDGKPTHILDKNT